MKELVIRVNDQNKIQEAFIMEDCKKRIKELQMEINRELQKEMHEDLSIGKILDRIADEVERRTGERPVFGPWLKNEDELFEINDGYLDLSKSCDDYDKIIIKWDS